MKTATQKLFGAILIALTTSSVIASDAPRFNEGHLFYSDHKDNGGDGIIGDNGEIVLRDFVRNNSLVKKDAQQIFKAYPEVNALFKNLLIKAPSAAEYLYENFEKLEFFFVDADLPLLPSAQTGFDTRSPDVQIAIKKGKRVLIDTQAFQQTQDREYLIIHEILHEVIKVEDDWSALKHTVVRQITNYLKNNLHDLDESEFNDLLRENIPYDELSVGYSSRIRDRDLDAAFEKKALQLTTLLFDSSFEFEKRCDIFHIDSMLQNYLSFGVPRYTILKFAPEFKKCEEGWNSDRLDEFKSRFPKTYTYTTLAATESRSWFTMDLEEHHQYREWERDTSREKCQEYASLKKRNKLTQAKNVMQRAKPETPLLKNWFATYERTGRTFAKIIIDSLSEDLKQNGQNIKRFNDNIKFCQEKFRSNQFYN